MEDFLGALCGIAAALEAFRAFRPFEPLRLAGVLAVILVGVLLIGVAALSPGAFVAAMQEDAWAEWGTVYAFLTAALLLAMKARRTFSTTGPLSHLAFLALILFCIFVAGEEISWGQRLLAFKPPDLFLEENFQQEFNVHNLLKGKIDSRYLVALVAFVLGVVYPPLARVLEEKTGLAPGLSHTVPVRATRPLFWSVIALQLIYPFELVGELAELLLGLTMTQAFSSDEGVVLSSKVRRDLGAVATSLLLGMVTAPILFAVVYGPDEELVAETERELKQLEHDLSLAGAVRPKLRRKSSVHKRLFTAVRAKYFSFGAENAFLDGKRSPAEDKSGVNDRRGYFLDPWNNPYWVYWNRAAGTLVVYSFGPNRRRDSSIGKTTAIAGDDIAVELPLHLR